eukprot:TRINITY_DN10329_c0_g1_i1.p1 TRINITY_DN10329_c0_g1~~TRINITY_DN10329_c0_g1_i1.p1  ORF type:complete len:457 (+),score=130.44 TRINITY_DN10329_c0_g1_i1:25-1395(+)
MAGVDDSSLSDVSPATLFSQIRSKDTSITQLSDQLSQLERHVKGIERQLEQKNAELQRAEEERKILDELQTVNQMSIRKLERERDPRHQLPAETLDNVIRLEDQLRHQKRKGEQALKEKKASETQVQRLDKELERVKLEIDQIQQETGWTPGPSTFKQPKDIRGQENRLQHLTVQVRRLEEEQRTNKQEQRQKTQQIEALSEQLDAKKHLEEDLYQAQTAIKMKDREIKELVDELKSLNRIHVKKDKLITARDGEKESQAKIRQLEGDKRFLQAELAKHVEARRHNDRTLKSQQYRISLLVARLEAIATAVKERRVDRSFRESLGGATGAEGVELTEDGAVTVEAFENVQRDVEALRQQLLQRDAATVDRDTAVEALEKRVEVLAHSKRAESRASEAERKELAAQVEDLKRALDVQQQTFQRQVDALERENNQLRAKYGASVTKASESKQSSPLRQ